MRWTVRAGDILAEPADALICSANPLLTLSGGVGGAFLLRYGDGMQRELEQHLRDNRRSFVPQGTVVACSPNGSPYLVVIHAVAVDAFYESSAEIVRDVLVKALQVAAQRGARTVALAALATGYGRLPVSDFADGARAVFSHSFHPVEEVVIVVRQQEDAMRLRDLLSPDGEQSHAAGNEDR